MQFIDNSAVVYFFCDTLYMLAGSVRGLRYRCGCELVRDSVVTPDDSGGGVRHRSLDYLSSDDATAPSLLFFAGDRTLWSGGSRWF